MEPRSLVTTAAALAVAMRISSAAASSEPWEALRRPFGGPAERPRAERLLCSFDQPICVHGTSSLAADMAERALRTAESAMRQFRSAGLPPPMGDATRGGSNAFDIYLDSAADSRAHLDAIPVSVGFDRSAAFATVAPGREGPPCTFSSDVARAVAQGMILGMDAAVNEGVLAAHSSWLAQGVAPCSALALDAIDRAQQRPDLGIATGSAATLSGNMLFPWFLDDTYGTGTYGAVMTGLLATSCQLTPAGEPRYVNEPDVFDALRQVTLDREMNFGELLVEYAISRAFMGDRSDGVHGLDVDWLDTLGRVRFEWAFGWKALPKQVAPAYPLDPTGAGYVWLDLADRPASAEVLIVADWEHTHVFQWAAVRLDAAGRELGRHLFGGTFGEAQAQLQLRELDGTASLLIIGTHVGNDDRSLPYDPESGAPRQASYTVTVHAS